MIVLVKIFFLNLLLVTTGCFPYTDRTPGSDQFKDRSKINQEPSTDGTGSDSSGDDGATNGTDSGADTGDSGDADTGGDSGTDSGTGTDDGADPGGDSGGSDSGGGTGGTGNPGGTLSEQYPNDSFTLLDENIVTFSGFENGSNGGFIPEDYNWSQGAARLRSNSSLARSGSGYLELGFERSNVANDGSAAVAAALQFTPAQNSIFMRFYRRRMPGTAQPRHGDIIRMYNPAAPAPSNFCGGWSWDCAAAGQRPSSIGKADFMLDYADDGSHYFYTSWHEMRAWTCQDGTTNCRSPVPSDAYYGNVLEASQPTVVNHSQWNCIEIEFTMNSQSNSYDGGIALWVNGNLANEYRTGTPLGAWGWSNFWTSGEYSGNTPFEGFNFRTSTAMSAASLRLHVQTNRETMCFEGGFTTQQCREWLPQWSWDRIQPLNPGITDSQSFIYDDVVVAYERIGCRVD